MAKVTLANFDKELEKILKDYQDDVIKNMDKITKDMGKKGSQLLRNESLNAYPKGQGQSTGKYAKNWTVKFERSRLYSTSIIHNREPGLPHLLEHGHAIVQGGRTVGHYAGREHIAPVEQKLIEAYEREVINKI